MMSKNINVLLGRFEFFFIENRLKLLKFFSGGFNKIALINFVFYFGCKFASNLHYL